MKFEEKTFSKPSPSPEYFLQPTNTTTTLSETNHLRALIHRTHYVCQIHIEQLASHRHLQLIKRILQRVVAKRLVHASQRSRRVHVPFARRHENLRPSLRLITIQIKRIALQALNPGTPAHRRHFSRDGVQRVPHARQSQQRIRIQVRRVFVKPPVINQPTRFIHNPRRDDSSWRSSTARHPEIREISHAQLLVRSPLSVAPVRQPARCLFEIETDRPENPTSDANPHTLPLKTPSITNRFFERRHRDSKIRGE